MKARKNSVGEAAEEKREKSRWKNGVFTDCKMEVESNKTGLYGYRPPGMKLDPQGIGRHKKQRNRRELTISQSR